MIALVGKNGCGKSTLLRSIASLQPIFEGSIFLNNIDLMRVKPSKRARLLSVVLTDRQLTAPFTVRELISIGRDPYTGWLGTLSDRDNRIVSEAIELTALKGFEERNVHELSDGELQRVFIARALSQDTELILLDEPTSHLDLNNRINILLLLQKLAREKAKTVILSTHELETAMQVADKLWLMGDDGEAITVGVPEDMVLNGTIETLFHHHSYQFDREYGSFVVQKKFDKMISTHLMGSGGAVARWTTKALTRKGYRIVDDALLKLYIDDENSSWRLQTDEGVEVVTHSIEELLERLSDFRPK